MDILRNSRPRRRSPIIHSPQELDFNEVTIILPILDSTYIEKLERYVPSEILPSGVKQLAAIALEHPADQDQFLTECYKSFDCYIDEMHAGGQIAYAGYFWDLLAGEDETEIIDIGLLDFHRHFIASVNALLGKPNFKLNRIISMRVCNAICVELKWPDHKQPKLFASTDVFGFEYWSDHSTT